MGKPTFSQKYFAFCKGFFTKFLSDLIILIPAIDAAIQPGGRPVVYMRDLTLL